MRGLRALAWLVCVAASANGPPKRNVAKAAAEQTSGATTAREVAARNAAAEMIKSKLATQTTRPVFEQGHGRRLQDAACEAYSVSGAEHQTSLMGDYVASGECDGKTLYDCVDCSSSNKQYLYYSANYDDWNIGKEGCSSKVVGMHTVGSNSGDLGLAQWTETTGSDWVQTSTISVRCLGIPNCDDVTPGSFTADDETIRTAVKLWFDDRCEAIKKYGHISTWETGGVADMSHLFCAYSEWSSCNTAAASFNEDIGAWDTSGVTSMYQMFYGAWSFNRPIGGWRVDQVTSMVRMFYEASAFEQDLGWCVRDDIDGLLGAFSDTKCWSTHCGVQWEANTGDCNVLPKGNTMVSWKIRRAVAAWLSDATAAEATYGHISTWETSGVADMSCLFTAISTWDCGDVYNMAATSFNEDIGAWDTSGVTDMGWMLANAAAFNQDIGDWAIDSVTDMSNMFHSADAFDQDLGWCVDDGVDLDDAFRWTPCASTSCGIMQKENPGDCDVASTGNVMVNYKIRLAVAAWLANPTAAEAVYGHISTWETSGVTDMSSLFSGTSFNEDIGAWDTSGVTTMYGMFWDASAFDQDLGWCVDDGVDLDRAFRNTPCRSTSCGVYLSAALRCGGTPMTDTSIRRAVNQWVSNATVAEATYGHISTWNTSGVTRMSELFCGYSCTCLNCWCSNCNTAAAFFNEDIGAWDTSGVTTMYRMFYDASSFNEDINAWNTSNVTDMSDMFQGASAFNQPIGDWRVDQVTDMNFMFSEASAFDQALGWCVRDVVDGTLGAFKGTKCEALSCGVVQGTCPDPKAATSDYCKLSDPELCSGSSVSFVEAPSNPLANIEDRYAIPMFADVDGDGNDDLLVGQENGTLAFYRNVESTYHLIVGDEDPFKSVAVDGHATPALADLDGDGNLDLVVGAADGKLVYFHNEGSEYQRVTGTPAPTTAPVEHSLRLVGGDSNFEGRVEIFHEDKWGTVCDDDWDIADANIVCQELFGTAAMEAKRNAFFGEGTGPILMDDVECAGDEAALWLCPFNGWGVIGYCDHGEDAGVVCEATPTFSPTLAPTAEDINDRDPFVDIAVDAHSAPAFTDLDGDGLEDLVIGKETAGTLTYYKNVGSKTAAMFQAVEDGPFANVGVGSFSKPTFYDLDNDGDQDLVVGDKLGNVLLFLNVGSRYVPEFSLVENQFAGIVPVRAAPTFGLLNGVPSLVVGSARGKLVVYGETPKVEFVTTKVSPFDGIDVGSDSKPAFVDLDDDGDLDLVLGEWDGTLNYYRNVGTQSQPNFQKVDDESPFDGIEVGRDSTPTFADLDNDGDPDLVVGDRYGKLSYFRNVGTPSQPNFQEVDCVDDLSTSSSFDPIFSADCTWYWSVICGGDWDDEDFTASEQCCACGGGLNKGENPFAGINVGDNSAPTFVDLDRDGKLDLVVGGGGLNYWRNVGTPSQPTFERVRGDCSRQYLYSYSYSYSYLYTYSYSYSYSNDSYTFEDEDDDGVARRLLAHQLQQDTPTPPCLEGMDPFNGINVGKEFIPTFADLDNDGDPDLVVGDRYGKLSYFRNVGTSSQPSFEKVGCVDDLTITDSDGNDCSWYDAGDADCGTYDDEDFTASEQCCACGGGLTEEESPFDGIYLGDNSAPTFVDIDSDGDPDLVVGDDEGRLSYFQNDQSCRKSLEDGTCSGNGLCLALESTDATCFCRTSYTGAQCGECAAGFYKLQCQECPGSTWSKPGVRQTCDECEAGFYLANNTCVRCGEDQVCETTDVTLANFVCRTKTYRDGDGCKDCSEGMICETTDVTRENFECQAGTYRVDDACKTCKDGMICDEPGVTIENVRLEKQYWRTSAESAKIETCPLVKSCRSTGPRVYPDANASAADGDLVRRLDAVAEPANATDAGEALCTKGHEGPLCAVCKKHYYRLGLECVKCRRSTLIFTIIGLIVGIIIFGVFFFLAMKYSNVVGQVTKQMVSEAHDSNKNESDSIGDTFGRQGSVRSYSRANSAGALGRGLDLASAAAESEVAGELERAVDRTMDQHVSWWAKAKQWLRKAAAADAMRRNVTTFVKQVTGTYSIFTSLPWIFDIKFPNLYEKVLERLAIINVDMSFSLECISKRRVTYQDRLLAATIGPVAAILVVISLGVLYLRFKKHKDEERDRKRTTTLVIAQLVLLIMFLSYTSTSTTIFRAFRPCDRLDENYHGSHTYMHDDYSVSCKSNRYIFIVTYAALMVLVYPIGIPLASFVLMWRNREKLNPKVDATFLDRKFETVGESDSAFRRARVEQKTELRNVAIQPKDDEIFSFAQLYHFMYDNYEPQYWWFECFDYLRRLALTGLMVIVLPGSALQGFIGVLIALGGLLSYNTFQPFVEDASDHLAMAAQLSTFFVFLSALMIQVNVVYHRSGFAALLTIVTFVPPFISLCAAFHSFYGAMKEAPEPDSEKAAEESAANPESSPTSPLARGAPPQEDEEQPAASNTD